MRELISMGHNVIAGGEIWQNELVSREIPGIMCIHFPGFNIRYSSYLPQYLKIILSLPLFFYHTITEHFRLRKIIRQYNIDITISDSRPGLRNRKIKSVLVTHMLRIPFPKGFRVLENLLLPFIRAFLKNFTFCLVPDLPGEINLSGDLSHNLPLPGNVRYTGILSRFSDYGNGKERKKEYRCVAIMSGPSPQREMLTGIISSLLRKTGRKSVIFAGPGKRKAELTGDGLQIICTESSGEMAEKILSGEIIVTRPGYTTLMELYSLGRSALIIPTPGQPEQEYLAGYLSGRGWFVKAEQNRLDAVTLEDFSEPLLPFYSPEENRDLLVKVLKELTDQ